MHDWQFWLGVLFIGVFIIYVRSVTVQTEKIENLRKRGLVRWIFLGIPFLVLIALLIYFWREIQFYARYLSQQ